MVASSCCLPCPLALLPPARSHSSPPGSVHPAGRQRACWFSVVCISMQILHCGSIRAVGCPTLTPPQPALHHRQGRAFACLDALDDGRWGSRGQQLQGFGVHRPFGHQVAGSRAGSSDVSRGAVGQGAHEQGTGANPAWCCGPCKMLYSNRATNPAMTG